MARAKVDGGALVLLLALSFLAAATSLPGCGDDKTKGSLCASCADEGEAACGTAVIDDSDLELFCGAASKDACNICSRDTGDLDGDGSTGEFICQVTLVCAHPKNSAAQRCYPVTFGTTTPQPDFECAGDPPQP
jgi:hypothetical protein